MAFTSCRCDSPSPSNRPGNRAVLARFPPFSIFPFPMLNQWSTRARADATPSVVPGPNLNTQFGPYQRTYCPISLHLAPVVFDLLTFSCMTDGRTYVRTYRHFIINNIDIGKCCNLLLSTVYLCLIVLCTLIMFAMTYDLWS